jgi:2,5-diketo-D-gluconate reductase A
MEKIYESGNVKAIGVSNFQPTHLRRLHGETTVRPAVNQIEVHPYFTNDEVRAFNAEHGIATEAWSPIAQGKVLNDPVIVRIAESLGKTPAQVTLRWHLQRGDIVFPKSVTRSRVEENFDLFDFELSVTDMVDITSLNRDERTGANPDTFAYVPR